MKKIIVGMAAAGILTAMCAVSAFAGEWKSAGGKYWYQKDDGTFYAGGIYNIDGTNYCFDGSGYMVTGWQQPTKFGAWYFFEDAGNQAMGWKNAGGKWYYLDPAANGAMKTGWFEDQGVLYYLDPNAGGAMQVSNLFVTTNQDNGETNLYQADGSGAIIRNKEAKNSQGTEMKYMEDGAIKFGPMQDAYKEYLTMMHDWYEKGLLDPDFSTRQSTGVAADNDMILNDKIGALIDWGTRMTDAYVSRGASNPDFWAVAAKQPKKNADDPDPAFRVATNNYHAMTNYCHSVSADSKYAELAVRWLDTFYAADNFWNANYGIESEEGRVWYKAEDGHRIGNYDFRYSNPDGLDSATVLVKYWSKNPPIRVEAAQIEQMPGERSVAHKIWTTYEPKNFIPTNLTMTVDEGTEYSSLYTDIQTYVQECNVKFIMGQMSLDEYDAYRDTLKNMGIDRCIELQQAALDRYFAR